MDTITLPTAADMHIHLRQGSLMTMVTPAVAEGGVSICYVMVTLLSSLRPCLLFFFLSPCVTFLSFDGVFARDGVN